MRFRLFQYPLPAESELTDPKLLIVGDDDEQALVSPDDARSRSDSPGESDETSGKPSAGVDIQ